MRGGMTAIAALVLQGAPVPGEDDGGRMRAPHLFDNGRASAGGRQRIRSPSSRRPEGATTRPMPSRNPWEQEAVREQNDRDSFAAEGSYFSSGRMQGEGRISCLELGGVFAAVTTAGGGRTLVSPGTIAPSATVPDETDAAAWQLMTPTPRSNLPDEKYAAYSPGKMFRSIRLDEVSAFGNILTAREICLPGGVRPPASGAPAPSAGNDPLLGRGTPSMNSNIISRKGTPGQAGIRLGRTFHTALPCGSFPCCCGAC